MVIDVTRYCHEFENQKSGSRIKNIWYQTDASANADRAVVNRAQYTYDKAPSDVGLGPTGFHPWRGLVSFIIVE